jgi:catechol 2,3-dioxygenase-like lactoylglutathione lyase family enzyme
MKFRSLFACTGVFLAFVCAQSMFAQTIAPTAPPDHVHLYVPDPEQSQLWYHKHFGGEMIKNERPDQPDLLLFDKTVFRFAKNSDAKPSDGSVLDRVGFTVDDVDAKTTELTGDGATLLRKTGAVAFLQDPWGGKIEILHPDGVPTNHLFLISLRAADIATLEKWVADNFGGTPDKLLGRVDGIKYGDMWVLFQKSDAETTPSRGHALDHIGWAVPDTNAAIAAAKAKGIKVTIEPRNLGPVTIAFIEGPDGLAIELMQTNSSGSH